MPDKKIIQYLQQHYQRHLDELFELLRFESIANHPTCEGCGPCADWLRDYLEQIGLAAKILPGNNQPYVFGEIQTNPAALTVLIYGHYDVQPGDPLDQWKTQPFEPQIRENNIFARGACDDKGPVMAWLAAIDALIKTDSLGVNVKILLEGEEEIGSPGVEDFLDEHRELLSCDVIAISDMPFFADGCPSVVTSLRGLCAFEVTFTGPSADVHSGTEGGVIANPINALASLIAKMHTPDGKVAIPGFYDDVQPVSPAQLEQWESLGVDLDEWARRDGVAQLAGGETQLHPLVRNWARPTLDCNGIIGGYTGKGGKTIIPSHASVKITTRLVANQNPEKIADAFERFVLDNTPAGIKADVIIGSAGNPVAFDTESKWAISATAAIEKAFGKAPVKIGGGGSIPITEALKRHLGREVVLMCLGLPDDNFHSPNEKFSLDMYENGKIMAVEFLTNLSNE